jgi:hypothetical protein
MDGILKALSMGKDDLLATISLGGPLFAFPSNRKRLEDFSFVLRPMVTPRLFPFLKYCAYTPSHSSLIKCDEA